MKTTTRNARTTTKTNNGAKLAAATLNTAFFVANPLGRTRLKGDDLTAYTRAWMAHSNMTRGAGMPKAAMVAIAGATMVRYHVSLGNLAIDGDNVVTITKAGRDFFGDSGRKINADKVNAFYSMLATGKATGDTLRNEPAMLVRFGA